MPSDPLVLGFDTSAAHCAAALLAGDRLVAIREEEMGRGQAERLMPMLEELLSSAGADWRDLTLIGVGTGPGNFTGIRISVAAARGLALSLGVPARGIDGFAATEFDQPAGRVPTLPAPRGQIYLRPSGTAPYLSTPAAARDAGLSLLTVPNPGRLAENIARLAARGEGHVPPAPLYLRPADAAPSKTPPPAILADDA